MADKSIEAKAKFGMPNPSRESGLLNCDALAFIAAMSCWEGNAGKACRKQAMAPAIKGAEKDVPFPCTG